MPSKIEWTDETWNPIVGCSKISTGCEDCYAEQMEQGGKVKKMPKLDGRIWDQYPGDGKNNG